MPARPTGSLLVLKALATLDGSNIFDCLDPSTDSQELPSLRLTCAELRQLVDCFGTRTLHIKLLKKDYDHDYRGPGASGYAQLREAGAALGRYHARLTGPVLPRKLCISAKTCRTCPARDEHGDGGGGGDIVAAYMAGYMSVAGVSALLARVTECCLAGDYVFGPIHSGVWYALAQHLTGLERLALRFDGNHAPLAKAYLLGMLPPSTQLRTLSIAEGEIVDVDVEECSHFLRSAAHVLKEHPITELHIMSRDALPNAKLLRALSDALPLLERLRVTPRMPKFAMPDDDVPVFHFQWLLPGNTFPTLRSISYQPYSNGPCPVILLSELDELLRDRPLLLHVGALKVVLTAACLAKQARYEHVERAQSASAADGGLGQLYFSLCLDDWKAAWSGMQLQELPITAEGGSGGQCTESAWSSSGAHLVHIWRGMESALAALAALLRPLPPPLPCAQDRVPPTNGLILKYMCGEDGADSAQDVAACVLETCCLLPTFTDVRVTVVGQLLRGGSAVPKASPAAAAAGQHGSSSTGQGVNTSAGEPCFPTSDAAERACWEEFVRQLSVRAPQLLIVEWEWQGRDGAACAPPAAWSKVASSGAPHAARCMFDLTNAAGSRAE